MRYEQEINGGSVPYVVPDVLSAARENMGQERLILRKISGGNPVPAPGEMRQR